MTARSCRSAADGALNVSISSLYEKAPALRSGGYSIDFWGSGYDIAEKVGLLDELFERGYPHRDRKSAYRRR